MIARLDGDVGGIVALIDCLGLSDHILIVFTSDTGPWDGRTVLFSSHLLDEVERVADLVAMLHGDRLVLTGPLDEIVGAHRRLTIRFRGPRTVRFTAAMSFRIASRPPPTNRVR